MNKVVHFEIPFDNKERAMKFYSQCFGWQLQDMPDMNYVMANTTATGPDYRPTEPGAINGGLFQRPIEPRAPPKYVCVESLVAVGSILKAHAVASRSRSGSAYSTVKSPAGTKFVAWNVFRSPVGSPPAEASS